MSHHLLMIEDDTRLATMVSQYLEQSGYSVQHADLGMAGLAQLASPHQDKAFDLVILDLMLPDMDGLEVCRRIRALAPPLGQTPVLMLTAKGDAMDRIIGLEVGADDYLPKPFEPRELLARKNIAHAAHRQDALGRLGIVLDGSANASHVNVNRPVKRFEFASANGFHDLVARQHPPGSFGQCNKQIKLVRR